MAKIDSWGLIFKKKNYYNGNGKGETRNGKSRLANYYNYYYYKKRNFSI